MDAAAVDADNSLNREPKRTVLSRKRFETRVILAVALMSIDLPPGRVVVEWGRQAG